MIFLISQSIWQKAIWKPYSLQVIQHLESNLNKYDGIVCIGTDQLGSLLEMQHLLAKPVVLIVRFLKKKISIFFFLSQGENSPSSSHVDEVDYVISFYSNP